MAIIEGSVTGNKQEVDASLNAFVKTPGKNAAGVDIGGGNSNAPALFTENDGGTSTGSRLG